MSQDTTGDVTPNTDEGTETLPENQETQTDEVVAEGDEDVVKKEESFYEKQLREMEEKINQLNEEAEKREKDIKIKNRAIDILKKKSDIKEPKIDDRDALKDSLRQELLSEVKSELSREKATQFIKTVTSDPTEQKVFLKHYESSSKTGDVEKDVLSAIAMANAPRILELLGRDRAEEANEDRSISAMSGAGVRSELPRGKTALRREIEKLLPKEMHKHIPIK